MPAIRGLTVAVGNHYAWTLSICLPRNMRHLTECVVVTKPDDEAVKAVVASVPGARVFETDAFTRPDMHGKVPRFNKGLAVHEAFDFMGRSGWFWVWDSDVIFPDHVPLDQLTPDRLHGCMRRMLGDPRRWTPGLEWRNCPRMRDGGPVGFTQIFHADDPAVAGKQVWYDVSFGHCGGGDAYFMRLWSRAKWCILPFDVLHLGRPDWNWMGTDQEGRDLMAKFVRQNGWRRALGHNSAEAAARAGELPGRLHYAGFEESSFELPFVQRAQGQEPTPRQ